MLAIDAALLRHPGARNCREAFSAAELDLLTAAVAGRCNSPPCTSLGRLFDGVASLLGLVQTLSFEGQGGLWLEGAAAGAPRVMHPPTATAAASPPGLMTVAPGGPVWTLDWRPWLVDLLTQRAGGGAVEALEIGRAHV